MGLLRRAPCLSCIRVSRRLRTKHPGRTWLPVDALMLHTLAGMIRRHILNSPEEEN